MPFPPSWQKQPRTVEGKNVYSALADLIMFRTF